MHQPGPTLSQGCQQLVEPDLKVRHLPAQRIGGRSEQPQTAVSGAGCRSQHAVRGAR